MERRPVHNASNGLRQQTGMVFRPQPSSTTSSPLPISRGRYSSDDQRAPLGARCEQVPFRLFRRRVPNR
jgi:hypothetical protein